MPKIFRPGLAAAILLACATSPAIAQDPEPTAATVPIKNFGFQAMSVTIAAGGSVTWKNLDGEPHTVVSTNGLFRSGALDQGDAFTFRFPRPGIYPYICSIHPQMRATVVVK